MPLHLSYSIYKHEAIDIADIYIYKFFWCKHETQSNRESCMFHFSYFELYFFGIYFSSISTDKSLMNNYK